MTEIDKKTPEEFQGEYLKLITKLKTLKRMYKASCELPPAEFHMLSLIRQRSAEKLKANPECPGVTTTEIMEIQGISISGVSKILGAMEKKGVVSRSPSRKDRRVSYLKVTPRGEELLDRMVQERNRTLKKFADRLGEENLGRFMYYCEVLYEVMREEWEDKVND